MSSSDPPSRERHLSHDPQALSEDGLAFSTPQPSPQPREHHDESTEKPKEDDAGNRLRVNLSSIDPNNPRGFPCENLEDVPEAAVEAETEPYDEHRGGRKRTRRLPKSITNVARVFNFFVPYGGLASSVFNLSSATLGAGIISTPSAFNLSGIAMSIVYLGLVLLGTVFSLYLLARVYEKTGCRTFSQAARQLLGPGADYLLATLLIVLCFGGSVSYVIATRTLLVPLLQQPGSPAYLKTASGNRLMTAVIWLLLMLPLAIPKRINSLRYVSTFGVFFVAYFVVCMMVHSIQNGLRDPMTRDEIVIVRTGNAALEGLGILMFALLSQINAMELMAEMRPFSVLRFTVYSAIAMTGCSVMYVLAGLFGYFDFGSRVTDSVLSLYDPVKDPYIAVGYAGIIVKICVAYALHMIPFRDAVYHLIHWNADTVPYWRHAMVMTAICTVALICGLFIPAINTVFGLMGSLAGAFIGMVAPSLFHMYCGRFTLREAGPLQYFGTYLLLIGGVVAIVFGTCTTIYSTVGRSFA